MALSEIEVKPTAACRSTTARQARAFMRSSCSTTTTTPILSGTRFMRRSWTHCKPMANGSTRQRTRPIASSTSSRRTRTTPDSNPSSLSGCCLCWNGIMSTTTPSRRKKCQPRILCRNRLSIQIHYRSIAWRSIHRCCILHIRK